ncbi:MAG: M14 family metallopeptidase [Bacteroidota bacterium]
MHIGKSINWPLVLLVLLTAWSCKTSTKWGGQAPIRIVPTTTLPIQKQHIGIFDLGEGIYASNAFTGARLNGIIFANDTITALITPENTPINPSPWYAFKIWADREQQVPLKLTYQAEVNHRYPPKLSKDGINWENLSEDRYQLGPTSLAPNGRKLSPYVSMDLTVGPDTLWVSAQELITSKEVKKWISGLASAPYVSAQSIGRSREGRAIDLLKIGNGDDQKMVFVLSRQHPPEVTGFLAMQAFVETIAGDSETAKSFREQYNTYVVPLANPDGVDNGHWRHNAGGIDLNRDWRNVNQPEVAAIQQFMREKVANSNGQFYFGVDFHSTWEDIYYTMHPELKGNMPGLVDQMIEAMAQEIKELTPNIRPGGSQERGVTSSQYFFHEFGAEALTYEIGDNTPRDLLKKKGEVSAMKLMEIMIERGQ